MKNIAIDLRTNHHTGVNRYGVSLAQNMIPLITDDDSTYHFIYHPEQGANIHHQEISNEKKENITLHPRRSTNKFIRNDSEFRLWLKQEHIDLYYSTHYLVDPHCTVPFIYTIHDLLRLKYPAYSYSDISFKKKYGNGEFEKIKKALMAYYSTCPCQIYGNGSIFNKYFLEINHYLAKHSAKIITVSNSVKKDITKLLSVPPKKISVIPGAVNEDVFYKRHEEVIKRTLLKYGVDGPYCMFVGLNHRHKRVTWLLETLIESSHEFPANWKFLLIGRKEHFSGELKNFLDEHEFMDFIVFTGRVSDEELATIYSGTEALVVSSIDEGYCLPAQEALTCHAEVIAPNISPLQETTDGKCHFYSVFDRQELSGLLVKAYKRALKKKATNYDSKYNWKKSAQELLSVLNSF